MADININRALVANVLEAVYYTDRSLVVTLDGVVFITITDVESYKDARAALTTALGEVALSMRVYHGTPVQRA